MKGKEEIAGQARNDDGTCRAGACSRRISGDHIGSPIQKNTALVIVDNGVVFLYSLIHFFNAMLLKSVFSKSSASGIYFSSIVASVLTMDDVSVRFSFPMRT